MGQCSRPRLHAGAGILAAWQLVRQGALSVTVDCVFPFGQIADAFAYLEQGRATGKVIVEMA
jgi:alcohol dehydrogenase